MVISQVIELKKQLQLKQETPDDPEALKCVPAIILLNFFLVPQSIRFKLLESCQKMRGRGMDVTLKVSDIEKENKLVPTEISKVKV